MNIKRALGVVLVTVMLVALLVSCDKTDYSEPSGEISKEKYYFHAYVVDVYEKSIMVTPAEGATEGNSSDLISVSLTLKSGDVAEGVSVGDKVRIVYNGQIMESYPAQIAGAYEIVVVEEGAISPSETDAPILPEKYHFEGRVLEVYEESILVTPTDEFIDLVGDKIVVHLTLRTGETVSGIKAGDTVRIVHTGQIMQSYPPQIGGPYEITVIK